MTRYLCAVNTQIDRRQFIKTTAAQGMGIGVAAFAMQKLFVSEAVAQTVKAYSGKNPGQFSSSVPAAHKLAQPNHPYTQQPTFLANTVEHEYKRFAHPYHGRVPKDIVGTLYRNGPGIYTRNNQTKTTIIDGDGMIRSYQFKNGKVLFRNKYVRTKKFNDEDAAGRFLYPTWTTGLKNRFLGDSPADYCKGGTADINIVQVNNRMFALSEGQANTTWEIDPTDLTTIGNNNIDPSQRHASLGAHPKFDPIKKEHVFLSLTYGPIFGIEINTYNELGQHQKFSKIHKINNRYIHDFFLTQNHILVVLHPLKVNVAKMLIGKTFRDSMQWQGDKSNIVIVIDRNTLKEKFRTEASAQFFWHTINAFEDGDTIYADFVTYKSPNHFLGKYALLQTVMHDQFGEKDLSCVRRYGINLNSRSITEEVLFDLDCEFPNINPNIATLQHGQAYVAASSLGAIMNNRVCRLDFVTGRQDLFQFGQDTYCGEPIYVASANAPLDERQGYLLVDSYCQANRGTQVNVFSVQSISSGPIATLDLGVHLPVGLHGSWVAQV